MAFALSRMMSYRTRRRAAAAAPKGNPAAAVALPARHPRVGLWVLSTFAVIASLVAISGLVIGPQNTDMMMVVLPLALFWSVVVCVGFSVRSALANVLRPLSNRLGIVSAEVEASADEAALQRMPEATLERLARMVRTERNRATLHPHLARTLVHAA